MSQELIEQCANGDYGAVVANVEAGADVNFRGTYGNTPLGYSASQGHVQIVQYLLDHGANVDALSYEDARPLGLAAYACKPEAVDVLLQAGADPNAADPAGLTALHFAVAKKEQPDAALCVEALLEAGALPNSLTKEDVETNAFYESVRVHAETPLHWAAASADLDTVKCLLEHGADSTITDGRGDTPAQWAGRHQRPAEIRELLRVDDAES